MVYRDMAGAEVSLSKLVRKEPEWAESRIRGLTEDLAAARADVERLRQELHIAQSECAKASVRAGERIKFELELGALREKVRGWASILDAQPLTLTQQKVTAAMNREATHD